MLTERRSRCHSLPLLSPTFRSHQLWTPLYLERLTVNQKNYHNYLRSPRANLDPAHTIPNVRIKKYGDNGFYLQKGIPVEQKYDVTQISRSTIRPWDQLAPRPLTSSQILSKESHLPFPSQHPYTSHISQFAMFPDPSITEQQQNSKRFHNDDGNGDNATCHDDQDANDHKKVHAFAQTDCSCFEQDPCSIPLYLAKEKTPANVIKSKAFSSGIRIECISSDHLKNCESNYLRPGIYRWDVSRSHSKKLQTSMTYPAPSTMYAPRGHPMANSKSLLNPTTFKELNSVNTRVTTSTAYKDHFQTRNSRLVFKRDQNMFRSLNDSRGKYARIPQFCSLSGSNEGNRSQGKLYHQQQGTIIPQTTGQESDIQTVDVCDQATQTDDYITDDNEIIETFADSQLLEPEDCTVQQPLADTCMQHVTINSPTMSGYAESYLRPSTTGSYCSTDEDGLDQYMCSYNKSEALRQFHNQYPSHTPDLRQYSISSGRRHIINGYHAYYWH